MAETVEDVVPGAFDGERIDRFVAAMIGASRSVAARLIDDGAVRIGRRRVRSGSQRIEAGATVFVDVPDPEDTAPQPDPAITFDVVYEDPHVVVIDKPAGLVVHPGAGNNDSTLVNGLLHHYPEIVDVGERHRPGIVHRLDRGTSGLLVIARSADAHAEMIRQMAAHEPVRIYRALAWGHPDRDGGSIDAPIGRSARHPTRMTVTPNGREARTHYRVLGRYDKPVVVSLLECRLETGRTHQIRVHLRAIGHPVVGDRDYDGGRPGLDPGRPFLHAGELQFNHPVSGELVEAHSDLPADLESVLSSLIPAEAPPSSE